MRIGPFKLFEKYVVRDGEDVYLIRWRLIETPWFGVFLHKICRPDHDRHLHDHPFPFVSIILRGGYVEEIPCDCFACGLKWIYGVGDTTRSLRPRFSVIRHRATDLHRIHELPNGPAWTLVLIGRRCRDWGFQTEAGWVQWQQYLAEKEAPPEPPAPVERKPYECEKCGRRGYLYVKHRFYQCQNAACNHSWFRDQEKNVPA